MPGVSNRRRTYGSENRLQLESRKLCKKLEKVLDQRPIINGTPSLVIQRVGDVHGAEKGGGRARGVDASKQKLFNMSSAYSTV